MIEDILCCRLPITRRDRPSL